MLINLIIIKNDTWNESVHGFLRCSIFSNRSIETAVDWAPHSERLAQPMSSFSFKNFSFNAALAYNAYILNLLSCILENFIFFTLSNIPRQKLTMQLQIQTTKLPAWNFLLVCRWRWHPYKVVKTSFKI